MAKRSDFARRPQDKYYTPYEAVVPLLPHLAPNTRFTEPCAGDGRLIDHLEKHGHECVDAFDVQPEREDVVAADALKARIEVLDPNEVVITNPPWTRQILHPLIERWRVHMPTWLLFDADWVHTKQSAPFMPYCRKIVSVGRVRWIEGTKMTGKDNVAWHLFTAEAGTTEFYGRTK